MIKETPHIKINKKTGQIDYTSACISSAWNTEYIKGVTFSYNTIIGVFLKVPYCTGYRLYYLETAGVYSQTTASKHKPRAAGIASYNNYDIISDIKPDALQTIANAPEDKQQQILKAILKEDQERQDIINQLYSNDDAGGPVLHAIKTGVINHWKRPDSHTFKNGNYQTKYYYKTNFKYLSNIYYELNVKHVKITVPGYNGRNGYKPPAVTNKIIKNIVNIEA